MMPSMTLSAEELAKYREEMEAFKNQDEAMKVLIANARSLVLDPDDDYDENALDPLYGTPDLLREGFCKYYETAEALEDCLASVRTAKIIKNMTSKEAKNCTVEEWDELHEKREDGKWAIQPRQP